MKRIMALTLLACMLFGTTAAFSGCAPDTTPEPSLPQDPAGPSFPQVAPTTTFSRDFNLYGDGSETARALLAAAGVTSAQTAAAKRIYVNSTADVAEVRAAQEKLDARDAHFNDYAIVAGESTLAIAAGSDAALTQAIQYLVTDHLDGNALCVPQDLSYVYQPALGSYQLADLPLDSFTVVCVDQAGTAMEAARDLAYQLSVMCGKEIPVTTEDTAEIAIRLSCQNGTENIYQAGAPVSYDLKCSLSVVTLEAEDRATLSYAMADFLQRIKAGMTLRSDAARRITFTYQQVDATDTDKIKYCGTWQANADGVMVSYWNDNYAEISFTGYAVTVEFGQSTSFLAQLDGGEYTTATLHGKATFFASDNGTHTLRIRGNSRTQHLYIRSFSAPEGANISRPARKTHYIQFVGDSISDAQDSFSHRVGEINGWDYSVIALSGMSLTTGRGYWSNNNPQLYAKLGGKDDDKSTWATAKIGMEHAFFRLGPPSDSMIGTAEEALYTTDYLLDTSPVKNLYQSGNTPDIVFIFLGTNDYLTDPYGDAAFTNTYCQFLDKITAVYGEDTQFCIMDALNGDTRRACIEAAYETIEEKHPGRVKFVDAATLDSWQVQISTDGIHPTAAGYTTLANKLAQLLASSAYYG